MIKHNKVTVTTTAVSLKGTLVDTSQDGEIVRSVLYTNTGAVTVYLGGSDVTSSSYGYALAAGASVALDLYRGDEVWAVTASGSADVIGLHSGVS